MAYTTVAVAVAKVVLDAKLQVLADFQAFLDTKMDTDDDIQGWFTEFKESLTESENKMIKEAGKAKGKKGKKESSSDSEKPKKTRSPSIFNLYVKMKMPEVKAKHPDVKDGRKLMTLAGEEWKSDPLGAFLKTKIAELKVEHSESTIQELFQMAMDMHTGGNNDAAKKTEKKKDAPKETKSQKETTKKSSKTAPKANKKFAADSDSEDDAKSTAETSTASSDTEEDDE